MRHFFAACPVATLSRGMAAASCQTILVAPSGALDRTVPGALSTIFGTINLAAVATAADHDLHPTAHAKEQPR
jgi:hypothetical protein